MEGTEGGENFPVLREIKFLGRRGVFKLGQRTKNRTDIGQKKGQDRLEQE